MAQMASLLVVATVFVALWTLNIYILQSERGGGLIHETKLPMQELEPKLQGGLIREGGRICGILRYMFLIDFTCMYACMYVILLSSPK